MKPEDIDKLFKERLGPSSPTPPADLWGRLQDRIETEMPAVQKEDKKPRGFMYLSYSIAAAIVLLLAVGIVLFNVQRGVSPTDELAQHNGQLLEQPLIITEPAATEPMQGIAQATEANAPDNSDRTDIPEVKQPAERNTSKAEVAATGTLAKVNETPATRQVNQKGSENTTVPSTQLVATVEKPVIVDAPKKGDYYNTGETAPVTFAAKTADMNAQPVEIIIKRAVAVQQVEEEVEETGFEKKQKLAKNIFKQVRNLSNGERVELSELGINANSIALETQIGKQKISKVIQL